MLIKRINNLGTEQQKTIKSFEKIEIKLDKNELLKTRLFFTLSRILIKFGVKKKNWVFISLSGGVDSMVILHLLVKLDCNIVAIHINYGNKKESNFEALFLQSWCQRFKIHFRKRIIHKIKRKTTKRCIYERKSRKIRFKTYLSVLKEFRSSGGIILGHHKGDVEENVLLNTVKGCSLMNLSGINLGSLIEGIHIWRPLLSHSKAEILDFAHLFGIPYLKNSTPIWSTRGKIRNQET